MKTYLVVLLTLIFIAPVFADAPPPICSSVTIHNGHYDSYEMLTGSLVCSDGTLLRITGTNYLNGDAIYHANGSFAFGYVRFRGTGIQIYAVRNTASGELCVDETICSIVNTTTNAQTPFMAFSVTGLSYDDHVFAWVNSSGVFLIDAVTILGEQPTPTPITIYPTPTPITIYPTPTAMDIDSAVSTAVAEVIAEMTVEVTVLLPEATDEPYGVPMTIEGTTGTQEGLFEYRATAGDSLITLTLIVLIVLAIAQLGVMLWKR